MLSTCENDKVLKVLLNSEKLHTGYISSRQPVKVQKNQSFIVDLDQLEDPEDILSDDLGAWEQTKTRSKWYQVEFTENGNARKITKVKDKAPGSYQVCRRPFVNKSDKSLKKTLVNVILPNGDNYNLFFARYHFEGSPEHAIKVLPHGNSTKSSIPYLRTYKSTKDKLEESVAKEGKGVKRILHEVEQQVGGLQNCSSEGALPRSARQVQYIKDESKEKDPIFAITNKMKLQVEMDGEKFIRAYSLDDDSPKVVLFTDDQVDDIVNFCCNDIPGHKSPLYVDVTFKLGPFYVLMTSYKNTTLISKTTGACPVMVGPILLCMLKDKVTYLTLFQKLTAQVPGLKMYLQGYTTDGEEALRQCLAQEFDRSLSFLCKVHIQRNIKAKCHNLHISESSTNQILDDIFGSDGLINAETEKQYRSRFEELKVEWDEINERETNKDAKFSKYFQNHKLDDIWNHATPKVFIR